MNSQTQSLVASDRLKYAVLLKRFPVFEHYYETVSHVSLSFQPRQNENEIASSQKRFSVKCNSIALAIPIGRKYFLWFSYRENSSEKECYLLGLNKDKQICSVEPRVIGKGKFPQNYSLGTIVYGTMYESSSELSAPQLFVAEDIYMYCGVPLHNLCFGNRLGFLRDFVRECPEYALPLMWFVNDGAHLNCAIPVELAKQIAYTPHHIQYREIDRVAPYINVPIPKRGVTQVPSVITSSAEVAQKMTATIQKPIPRFDYAKPVYRYPAVFNVKADPQLDLYHLYAFSGGIEGGVYCGLAGVQSYKTSVFMNRLFRRIRENENLDLAEESEEEEDFENMDANKFVYLDRTIPIECIFNMKHRKWIPTRLASKEDKVIHIEKLVLQNSNGSAERTSYRNEMGRGGFKHNNSNPKPRFQKR